MSQRSPGPIWRLSWRRNAAAKRYSVKRIIQILRETERRGARAADSGPPTTSWTGVSVSVAAGGRGERVPHQARAVPSHQRSAWPLRFTIRAGRSLALTGMEPASAGFTPAATRRALTLRNVA